jgi:thioesterase domain-containing protein
LLCAGAAQIAEQMILQLEAHGQEVEVFVILDTWVMEFVHRRWGWRLLGYHQRLDWLRRATTRERLNWVTRALTNRLRTWAGKVKPSQPWKDAYWPRYFKPPRFRAPIVLFKRPKQPYYYIDDPTMGWGARSQGGVEIHEINAAHHEFLREPYAEIISRVLMTRLPSSPSLADEWATGSVLANEVTAVTAG